MSVLVRIFLFLAFILIFCSSEKETYLSFERPMIQYYNKKYMTAVQFKSLRHSRNDPRYYIQMTFIMKTWCGNNLTIDFYWYESVGLSYRRSYIDMHFRLCDLVEKDKFIGGVFKKALQEQGYYSCPYGPGLYTFSNLTFPTAVIPKQISITKGRLWMNSTIVTTKEMLASGYVDVELKQFKKKTVEKKI